MTRTDTTSCRSRESTSTLDDTSTNPTNKLPAKPPARKTRVVHHETGEQRTANHALQNRVGVSGAGSP